MELTVREQIIYWGIAALFALVMLWLLGNVILPFILGGAVAYFLDPAADRLQNMGLSRTLATVIISLVAILTFIIVILLVMPTLIEQAVALVDAVPRALPQAERYISQHYPEVFDEKSFVRQSLNTVAEAVRSRSAMLTDTLLASAMGLINFLFILIIVPVVAFYMLLDWDRMVAKVQSLLPREHAPTIYRLAEEIDDVLAGFVRGQLTVCLILGTFYGLALMIIGLNYGLVIGVSAGLIAFIPYVGTFIGGLLSIGVAMFQFWDQPQWLFAVIGVFVFGQFVEGNFLSPKLVGGSVGLHPVWLMLALSAFGALFGFVGMLVAVPVTAALGVFARFGVERYKDSRFYRGTPPKLDVNDLSEQLALPLSLPPAMGRGDFVTSPANALALAQIEAWADWPGGKLVLAGPEGSGKSHLAHIWAAEAGAVILVPDDLRSTPADALASWGRVVVEDAAEIAGEAEAEVTLFHLHNLLAGSGRLLLTAPSEPARWGIGLPDLASRLEASAVARLEPPDDALLAAVLAKLFADRQIAAGPALVDWLVSRIERTLDAARRVVALIDQRALAEGRTVGVRLAAEVLEGLCREAE